jgi:hypothetical protein
MIDAVFEAGSQAETGPVEPKRWKLKHQDQEKTWEQR